MTYTGDVTVGGPPDVRELPRLRVTKVAVGAYDNNVYLLRCAKTGSVLMVDAAAETGRLLELVGSDTLVGIVQTHGHGDHIAALSDVVAATGAPVYCHPDDWNMLPAGVDPLPLRNGEEVAAGDEWFRVIHLRGHTPGGLALHYFDDKERPHLFTGDSLFPGGPGNTFGDAAHFDQLMTDLEKKVFTKFPDETWVYPGHGKDTTLGAERQSLPEWRARGW